MSEELHQAISDLVIPAVAPSAVATQRAAGRWCARSSHPPRLSPPSNKKNKKLEKPYSNLLPSALTKSPLSAASHSKDEMLLAYVPAVGG